MTRIAVFCDGTWNSPTNPEPTHVHKLQQAILSDPSQGQVSVYFKGIGTDERFDGPVKRAANRYGGGIFGWGLDAKVKQAYQFIAQAYQPGDEIFLFGFSRGAFTARSVAGMIRKCGIAKDTSPEGINRAFRLYRRPGARNAPDVLHIRQERREISPGFATSEKDLKWRKDNSALVKIAYIGVWDTVGARGLPLALLGPVAALWNMQYKFHDMKLSSTVASARHAVALDEQRVFYRPALWDNLEGGKGLNGGQDADPKRKYQQIWFVGNHSIVGGSGDSQPLAAFTQAWIYEGAHAQGLAKADAVQIPQETPNALAETGGVKPETGWFKAWRKGPRRAHNVHASAEQRLSQRPDYRPGSLSHL